MGEGGAGLIYGLFASALLIAYFQRVVAAVAGLGPDLWAEEGVADAFGGFGGCGWFGRGDFGWAGPVCWLILGAVLLAERFGRVQTVAKGHCVTTRAFHLGTFTLGLVW